ncbi:vanadium-dependent haloperoxidase [Streptomyces sp. NPDC057148]|uniref:vanadium-dependent haloperoxidase n=1 Tax=unclassified Streptomyces TaxID=2593676 RepID=UPI003626DD84
MARQRTTDSRKFRAPLLLAGALAMAVGSLAAAPERATAVQQAERAAQAEQSDHVVYWNKVLVESFQSLKEAHATPGSLARAGAMMNVAVYDAVNAIEPIGKPYLIRPTSGGGGSVDAAIDHAAYGVLSRTLPQLDFTDEFETALAMSPSTTPEAFAIGKDIGEKTSRAITFLRERDASSINVPYTPGDQPGDWRPTSPGVPPLTPNWGRVKPFGIEYGSQFRPPLPPALTSAQYAAEMNEVKEYGGADPATTKRSAEQTEIAHFWANDLDGTYKAPGHLYALTNDVVEKRWPDSRPTQTARLYALMSIALADAGVAAWDAKYITEKDLWRPETAIRLADTDGNTATTKDASWQPLSQDLEGNHFSPPFPAYVSGHATYAAAWAGIMKRYTGSDSFDYTLEATTVDPFAKDVVRSFNSFSEIARENALSRIYLGVHFRSDAEQGLAVGDKVADYVYNNSLR